MHRVFVYGTLLRGLSNHHWLDGATFAGPANTGEAFRLVDLGEYPAALLGEGGPLVGEVWCVDDSGLARLDELEDYPALYDRQVRPMSDGSSAWVYLLNPAESRRAAEGTAIGDGDYRSYLGRKHRAGPEG